MKANTPTFGPRLCAAARQSGREAGRLGLCCSVMTSALRRELAVMTVIDRRAVLPLRYQHI